ncbi:MAG: DinB family protein [Terriglobia bacterium]
MDLKEFFLKQKEAIRGRTRQVVTRVRPEQLAWRPEKDALSVDEMLRHLWVSEAGVRRVALEGDFTYYETRIPQGLRAVLGTPGALKEELAHLERTHSQTLAAVAAFPLERFEEERAHSGLGFRRKVYAVLFGINEHEIHHRAQLMTYLRILGTPVPEALGRR